jgi:pyruvate formate lyase activating enzyme
MKREKISVDFGHIVPVSTVDWYKKSSCVVFFNKCPLRCIWCQNHKLLEQTNIVNIDMVKKKIEESMDFVTCIVFSGGEPCLQDKALDALIRFSRRNDLLTAVQTSGYYPLVINKLIENDLLDKIFLDIKTSPSDAVKYESITGVNDAHKKMFESFKIINMSRVTSEIRTTVFRPFINDVFDIAEFLEKHNYRGTLILQPGVPNNAPEGDIRKEKRIEKDEMKKIAKNIAKNTGIAVTYK